MKMKYVFLSELVVMSWLFRKILKDNQAEFS